MPDLRAALLKEHLRQSRLGTPIRASLISSVYEILQSLKEETRRTYRDILLIILNVFKHHPEFFPIDHSKKARQDIFFRLSKKDSMTVLVWAWKRNQRRSNFIGDLVEQFFDMVPVAEFKKVLESRVDQAIRLKEDVKKYGRGNKRKINSGSSR